MEQNKACLTMCCTCLWVTYGTPPMGHLLQEACGLGSVLIFCHTYGSFWGFSVSPTGQQTLQGRGDV